MSILKVQPVDAESAVRRGMKRCSEWMAETKQATSRKPNTLMATRIKRLAAQFFVSDEVDDDGRRFRVKKFAEIDERLSALESQAEHLKNFGYVGTWQKGAVHHKGHFVTDGGGMWCCMRDNAKSRPGTNGDDWRLCVKRGAMT